MRFAAIIALVLCASRPADACIPVFTRGIIGAPAFEPADAVTITHEDVDVTCDEHYTCDVVWTFGVEVRSVTRVSVTGYQTAELEIAIEGAPPAKAARDLHPGDARFVVRGRVSVPTYIDGCFTDGVIARHPYLASGPTGYEHVLQIDTTRAPRVKYPDSWSLVVDQRAASKYDPATTRLWFAVPGRRITHGGPYALIGAASDEGETFRLRAGWEAAVVRPWFVLGLSADTDFGKTWNVALVAEPTSSAWVLPLSFGAGGGVVVANGGRIGGRGQLSIALGPARVVLSLDVVGSSAGTDLGLAGLIGAGI